MTLFCILMGLPSEVWSPFLNMKHLFLFKAVKGPDHCLKKRIFPRSPFYPSVVTDAFTLLTSGPQPYPPFSLGAIFVNAFPQFQIEELQIE